MEFEKCMDILRREEGLVRRIGEAQDAVYAAVTERRWDELEGRFEALNAMGGELSALEAEREGLFPADSGGGFYAFAAKLPEGRRREIADLYRDMKIEVLRVRSAGEALMGYIAGARATMAGFFEAAFPARQSKTYSPKGAQVAGDMRSMMLNQRF